MRIGFIVILILLCILIVSFLWGLSSDVEFPRYLKLRSTPNLELLDRQYSSKPRVNSRRRVVISMTTLPSRDFFLYRSLSGLLDSTVRVDEIAVNIPWKTRKGKEYEMPDWLTNLQNVTVHRVDKDYGPSTKLIPTLKREKQADSIIIVVDDDAIYGSQLAEKMVKYFYQRGERDAIAGIGGFINKETYRVDEVRFFSFMLDNYNRYSDIVLGVAGFLVIPSFFPDEVFDYSIAPPEAQNVDDIWFSGWLAYNGVKIWSIRHPTRHTSLAVSGLWEKAPDSLSTSVNEDGDNNAITARWFHQQLGVQWIKF